MKRENAEKQTGTQPDAPIHDLAAMRRRRAGATAATWRAIAAELERKATCMLADAARLRQGACREELAAGVTAGSVLEAIARGAA